MDNGQWESCPGKSCQSLISSIAVTLYLPGQDNTSNECTVGDVPNIFVGSTSDHGGPYDGIEMGC
jgi:hypothetical protein